MNLLLKSVLSLGLIVVNLFAFSFSDIASQIESKTKGLVKVTLSDSNLNLAGEKINNKEKRSLNLNYSENNLNFYTIESMNYMNFDTSLYFDDSLKSYNPDVNYIANSKNKCNFLK